MLLDLRELLSGTESEITKNISIEQDKFSTGTDSYVFVEKPEFLISIKRLNKNRIRINAEGFVILDVPCDRCLESVKTRVDFSIDEVVDFNDDACEDEAKQEKDYIGGYELDTDKLVFEELLISMPGKTLCSPDCKGLCFVCGANLNIAECGCNRESLDPRMSVFKDILNNFKEV